MNDKQKTAIDNLASDAAKAMTDYTYQLIANFIVANTKAIAESDHLAIEKFLTTEETLKDITKHAISYIDKYIDDICLINDCNNYNLSYKSYLVSYVAYNIERDLLPTLRFFFKKDSESFQGALKSVIGICLNSFYYEDIKIIVYLFDSLSSELDYLQKLECAAAINFKDAEFFRKMSYLLATMIIANIATFNKLYAKQQQNQSEAKSKDKLIKRIRLNLATSVFIVLFKHIDAAPLQRIYCDTLDESCTDKYKAIAAYVMLKTTFSQLFESKKDLIEFFYEDDCKHPMSEYEIDECMRAIEIALRKAIDKMNYDRAKYNI